MVGRVAFDLEIDDIVDAAIAILTEKGLAAVSMRNVATRLGVSPVPLYSRVGNKDALLDAMAERLLADMTPQPTKGEAWPQYATRWAHAVRDRLAKTADMRLLVGNRRSPFVTASRPLIEVLRAAGFDGDAAVQATRLLLWAVVGFGALEHHRGGEQRAKPSGSRRPGGDPSGVSAAEADQLFALHVAYLIAGIERDR